MNMRTIRRPVRSESQTANGQTSSVPQIALAGGAWDKFAVARFVDLVDKRTGGTIDADEILRRYDINGDGMLGRDEQTAMIKGLAVENRTNAGGSGNAQESFQQSVVDQLKAMSRNDEHGSIETASQRNIRRYENMFWFENIEAYQEPMLLGVI